MTQDTEEVEKKASKKKKAKPATAKKKKVVAEALPPETEDTQETEDDLETEDEDLETVETNTGSEGESEDTATTDSEVEETDTRDILFVFSSKCMRCGYLSDKGKQFYDACHHSNGNESCPAQGIRIMVGLNFEVTANRMVEAIRTGNTELLAKINTRLSNKDEVVVKKVMALVTEKMKA